MTAVRAVAMCPAEAARLSGLADGLDVLIRLHDRELDAEVLYGLQSHHVAESLIELLAKGDGQTAARALATAISQIGPEPDDAVLDELAADYADLYLTHGYRVAPSGSVWLTEDKLERQLPMFEVRDWYEHYGVSVPDWRVRADDHLVHELQFVSLLCHAGNRVAAQDAGRFMDLHVLPWMPEFCRRAAARVNQPVYAAMMTLTGLYLDELRTALETITGLPRDVREVKDLNTERAPEPEAEAYVPGLAESW